MPRRTPSNSYQQRLDARMDKMRARILVPERSGVLRNPTRREYLALALEYAIREQEAGQPVIRGIHQRWLRGARQVDGGSPVCHTITLAELASLSVYPALLAAGRAPTPAERALLRADAALLEVGQLVTVRGKLFSGRRLPEARVGHDGTLAELPERGNWCTVSKHGRLRFAVHRWDLLPVEYLDPPRRTRF